MSPVINRVVFPFHKALAFLFREKEKKIREANIFSKKEDKHEIGISCVQ